MKKSALNGLKSFNSEERRHQAMPDMNLSVPVGADSSFAKIPLRLISPNPAQPRRHYSEERLQELVLSIKERGVLQPIRVTEVANDEYRIIAGERRFRAAALAGLSEIPAIIVRGQSDEQAYIDAVVENLLRENLNALDRALALSRIKISLGGGFKEVARRVGLTERRVFHLMGLMNLPDSIQNEIRVGNLNEKHGRALRLLQKQPHLMEALLAEIKCDGLSGDAALKRSKQLYGEAPPIRSFSVSYRSNAELKHILEEKLAELQAEESREEANNGPVEKTSATTVALER
jgi:ParB/RepB/Spo0J family partition protein